MQRPLRLAAVNLRFLLILSLILVVVVVGAGGAWYYQKRVRSAAALEVARQAIEKKQWADAIENYTTFLRQQPNDIEALHEYSKTLRAARPQEMDHLVRMITADRRILRFEPDNVEVYRRLLKLYYITQQFDNLRYVGSLAQQPEYAAQDKLEAELYVARADVGQQRYRDAKATLDRLMPVLREQKNERKQLLIDALMLSGRIAEETQRPGVAGEFRSDNFDRSPYEEILELDPTATDAALNLVQLKRAQADARQSHTRDYCLRLLAAAVPKNAPEMIRLANAYLDLDDPASAQRWLAAAREVPDPIGLDQFPLTADFELVTFVVQSRLVLRTRVLPPDGLAFVEHALAQLPERVYRVEALPQAIRMYLLANELQVEAADATTRPAGAAPVGVAELDRAAELMREYEAAIPLVERKPSPETTAFLRGLLAHRRGEYPLTIHLLEPLARPNADAAADIYGLLADTYARVGQFRRAVRAADSLAEALRPAVVPLKLRAQQVQWCIAANDWRRAAELVEEWTSLPEGDADLQILRQRVLLRTALQKTGADREEALTEIGRVIDSLTARFGENGGVADLHADWLAAQNRTAEAEAVLKAALEKNPDSEDAQFSLTRFYLAGRRFDDAEKRVRARLAKSPTAMDAWIELIDLLIDSSRADPTAPEPSAARLKAAEEAVAEAEKHVSPTDRTAATILSLRRAEIAFARRDVAAADRILSDLQQRLAASGEPSDAGADGTIERFWLRSLDALGEDTLRANFERASQLVARLREIEKDTGIHWRLWKANLLLLNKPSATERREAIELLQAVRAADPDWERAILLLGKAYELNQDWTAAEALYNSALKQLPQNPAIGRSLAELLQKLGRRSELARFVQASEAFSPAVRVSQKAGEAIDRGDLDTAERELREFLRESDDVQIRVLLTQVMFLRQRQAEPAKALETAMRSLDELEARPDGGDAAFASRISLLLAAGEGDRALELMNARVQPRLYAASYHQRGGVRQRLRDFAGAEADFRKTMELRGDDPLAAEPLGTFFVDTGRLDQAIALWRDELQQHRNSTRLKRLLAKALLARGTRDDRLMALSLLDELDQVQARADDPELLKLRALAKLHDAGARREVISLLEQAIALDPGMEDAHLILISFSLESGDTAEAQRLLQRALETNPRRPRLLAIRARLEIDREQYGPATVTLRDALQREPDNIEVLEQLVRLIERDPQSSAVDTARSALQIALQLHPGSPRLHELQAQVLRATGDAKGARRLLDQFVANDRSGEPGPHLLLMELARAEGDDAAVVNYLKQAVQIAPNHEQVLWAQVVWAAQRNDLDTLRAVSEQPGVPGRVLMLIVQLLQRSPDTAARDAARTIAERSSSKLAPDDPIQLGLGLALYELGAIDPSVRIYNAYLEQRPDDPRALNNLAWIIGTTRHDLNRALAMADRGLTLAPGDSDLHDTRGHLLMLQGKHRSAMEDFRKAAVGAASPAARARAWLNFGRAARQAELPAEVRSALDELERLGPATSDFTAEEKAQLQDLRGYAPRNG
jgi:predicted Zn-dependent protease